MKIIVALILFVSSLNLFSNNLADSLTTVWKTKTLPDTVRFAAVKQLVWKVYLHVQVDSSIKYSQEQYDFALKIKDKTNMAAAKNSLGVAYRTKGEYIKAIESLEQCILIYEELKDDQGVAGALGNLGILYMSQAEYGKALKNFLHCYKVFENAGNIGGMLNAINYIGGVYIYQNEFEKAHKTYQEGLQIARKEKDKLMEAYLIGNMGLLKQTQGDLDSALYYFFLGLKMDEEAGNLHGAITTKLNVASVYLSKKDYQNSEKYYNECIAHYREIGEKKGVSMVLTSLSEIQYDKGNIVNAKQLGEESLVLAKEVGDVGQLKAISHLMYKVYKDLNNSSGALKMHELYMEMADSLRSEEDKKEVLQQSFQFQYDKKVLADSLEQIDKDNIAAKDLSIEKEKTQNEKQKQYFLIIGIVLSLVFGIFILNRFRLTNKQKKIIEEKNIEVESKRAEAELQKEIVEVKNKEIMDSINYAKRLQDAILPTFGQIDKVFRDYFLIYKPKDIVAGDFYWVEEVGDWTYFAVADCTGHGVPGAMVSVVCANALSKALSENSKVEPGPLLDRTREIVVASFGKGPESIQDGMDISLGMINLNTKKMKWAGANNSLWIVREKQNLEWENERIKVRSNPQNGLNLIEIKGDKQPIGKYLNSTTFETIHIDLEENDRLYLFTDGFADQFGGEDFGGKKGGKKLKSKVMKDWILAYANLTMSEQKNNLSIDFETWKGDFEQVDDVCILGLKV